MMMLTNNEAAVIARFTRSVLFNVAAVYDRRILADEVGLSRAKRSVF
jgi:hypothetical protein